MKPFLLEYWKKYKLFFILAALLGLDLAAFGALGGFFPEEKSIFLLGLGTQEWIALPACIGILLAGTLIVAGLWRILPRWGRIVLLVIAVVVILAVLLMFAVRSAFDAGRYYSFISPDGSRTLVVREEEFLFASWGTFYQLTGPNTMEKIGQFNIHDLFPQGQYSFQWGEENCTVTFCGITMLLPYIQ